MLATTWVVSQRRLCCSGDKSNVQFELIAPDDLPPGLYCCRFTYAQSPVQLVGPRNGYVDIWDHAEPAVRLCRFAFTIKVAVGVPSASQALNRLMLLQLSLPFLEYTLGPASEELLAELESDSTDITICYEQEQDRHVGDRVADELQKAGHRTFTASEVQADAKHNLLLWCHKVQQRCAIGSVHCRALTGWYSSVVVPFLSPHFFASEVTKMPGRILY